MIIEPCDCGRDCGRRKGCCPHATKCEKCGKTLEVGQWPWCPHEDARNFGEAPLEPYWDEHVSPEGAYITTRAERRRIMAQNKMEYHDVSKKRRGKIYVDLGR